MKQFLILIFGMCIISCDNGQETPVSSNTNKNKDSSIKIVLASEVKWEQLNPARGEKSPKAGTLWGNRKGSVPTGFLVKFVDGFSSPPHIHNVTYRGVVINGHIHNDDPKAAPMWMPKGSFWTQPKGEVHITAAKGKTNIAFIEIDKGPYLVLPKEKAIDSGERPINVDPSNIVWIEQPGTDNAHQGVKLAFLWGKPQFNKMNGSFIKLSNGFKGKIRSFGSIFRAVIIKGQTIYYMSKNSGTKTLLPGSYFSSKGKSDHAISCKAGNDCIIYISTKGKYKVVSSQKN